MEKRGIGHHLDWIIGITLFMLYIVFMIVTIKPGVQPLQNGETLLNIVQDNFVKSVSWEITKVPLAVTSHCSSTTKLYIKTEFPFTEWTNEKTKMIQDSGVSIPGFGIISTDLIFTNTFTETLPYTKRFYLLHSEEFDESNSFTTPTSICSESSETVNYIYGVPELLNGLSDIKISNTNYDQVKNRWNYPTTNYFNVSVTGIDEISGGIAPASNANVYVRQFTDFILNEKGEKTPVTVTITVW